MNGFTLIDVAFVGAQLVPITTPWNVSKMESMDLAREGQPMVVGAIGNGSNLSTIDFAVEGQPFVQGML